MQAAALLACLAVVLAASACAEGGRQVRGSCFSEVTSCPLAFDGMQGLSHLTYRARLPAPLRQRRKHGAIGCSRVYTQCGLARALHAPGQSGRLMLPERLVSAAAHQTGRVRCGCQAAIIAPWHNAAETTCTDSRACPRTGRRRAAASADRDKPGRRAGHPADGRDAHRSRRHCARHSARQPRRRQRNSAGERRSCERSRLAPCICCTHQDTVVCASRMCLQLPQCSGSG